VTGWQKNLAVERKVDMRPGRARERKGGDRLGVENHGKRGGMFIGMTFKIDTKKGARIRKGL